MRWFLVRLGGGEAEGFPTREMANDIRDRLHFHRPRGGFNKHTVEVIPVRAITDMIREWDRMITVNEFEHSLTDGRPALTLGEIAIIRAMRQDMLERLAAQ